jgi:hypothetical protein
MVYRGFSVAASCSTVSLLHSTTQPDAKASISAGSLDEVSLRLLLAKDCPTAGCPLSSGPLSLQLIAAEADLERLA